MKLKNVIAIILGCVAIFSALVIVDVLEPDPAEAQQKPRVATPVSAIDVVPSDHDTSLNLLATTTARWPVQLKATSSAQLAWLNPDIEPGALVEKGTELARLDSSALASHLAEARSNVKQAELSLKQALHEQTVALKMLSPNKSSPFARREPQVSVARAELVRAKQALVSSEKILQEARIVAPFDAVVMRRNVSPREWLESGQVLFELAASDSLDVELPVSNLNWQKVQLALVMPQIQVMNQDGQRWPAKVRYVAPQADSTTRQRQVVLSVSHPYRMPTRLLPNQQVKVEVNLGRQPNIVTLPMSAITRDGYVWTISEDQRLQKERVQSVGQQPNQVYVRFEQESAKQRKVVIYPLISMLPGKRVSPQLVTMVDKEEVQ